MTGRVDSVRPEFVEFIPDRLEEGVVYVSIEYKSIAHLCCCGCGRKVVTPLSPTGWRFTFDGRSISLCPSVGNWQKDCKSHYLVIQNRVRWAPRWSAGEIAAGLEHDRQLKQDYYGEGTTLDDADAAQQPAPNAEKRRTSRWWRKPNRKA